MNTYPWYHKYPEGIEQEINPDQYTSLVDLLEESFERYKQKPAFSFMGKELTFQEIEEASRHFAAYLQSIGLKEGDKLGLQMPNIMQYPIALFGALRAGLTVVNINPLYTAREMEHQYKDADVKATVIISNFAYNLEKILPKVDLQHIIVTDIGDMLGGLKGSIVNFVVKYVKKMVPKYHLPGKVPFKEALKIGAGKTFTKPVTKAEDLAFLQYTGGTTVVSKGAMLTHRNVVANMLMIKEWMKPRLKEGADEIVVTPLPLYHIFALTVNCFSMFNIGAKNVLIANPRDIPGFIKELKSSNFTVLTGLNTLYVALMNHPTFKEIDFSRVKVVVAGGIAMQKPVVERWRQLTGTTIAEGYGLSETAPVLTCNPIDGTDQVGTIGLPVPSTHLKLIDEEGNEVKLGEPGEICAKGPQVMKGYWNRPEETVKVMTDDGYFKTGDIGIMLEDGYFKIVDRKKDMILVSGFNVYPNEIEDVVAGHPKVLEVAAIGMPDEKATERVKLYVVKKDASLTEDELKAFCKENLTGYKQPKMIEFREELPKSNVGKILRKRLKDELKEKQTADTVS